MPLGVKKANSNNEQNRQSTSFDAGGLAVLCCEVTSARFSPSDILLHSSRPKKATAASIDQPKLRKMMRGHLMVLLWIGGLFGNGG